MYNCKDWNKLILSVQVLFISTSQLTKSFNKFVRVIANSAQVYNEFGQVITNLGEFSKLNIYCFDYRFDSNKIILTEQELDKLFALNKNFEHIARSRVILLPYVCGVNGRI